MYSAIYLPATEGSDPSRGGFKTQEEAWRYIEDNHLCSSCQGDEEEDTSMTSCGAEWLVMKTEKAEQAEDLGDLLMAAGYKRVWNQTSNAENADTSGTPNSPTTNGS